jgi:hypothetical protein
MQHGTGRVGLKKTDLAGNCFSGLETKESVGGIHQVLSANQATEFPGVTAASSCPAQ